LISMVAFPASEVAVTPPHREVRSRSKPEEG
jgi:hypothetical protein